MQLEDVQAFINPDPFIEILQRCADYGSEEPNDSRQPLSECQYISLRHA